jgi:hypothetical protein
VHSLLYESCVQHHSTVLQTCAPAFWFLLLMVLLMMGGLQL